MTSKRLHPAARLVTYFLLWLFAFPVSLPAQDLAKLTVAYSSRSIAPIDYFIAEQSGIFKAESLDVRLVQIRAAVAVAAMLAVAVSTAVWRDMDVPPVMNSAEERADRPDETLRLNADKTSVATLTDGSRVEMREGSEASVVRLSDGLRIELEVGSIIVNAARQAPGIRSDT